ncbi:unnamed protein product, partial [Thlaspi arvense]
MMDEEFDTTLKLPARIYEPGTEPKSTIVVLQNLNLLYVDKVTKLLGDWKTDRLVHCERFDLLENNANRMSAEEKLSLGAAILTHGIIISKNPTVKISRESAIIGYEVLSASIHRIQAKTFAKGQYEVKGFVWAITLWALSAVPALGTSFGSRFDSSSSAGPLCLQWKATQNPFISDINNILNMLVILARKVKIIQQVLGISEENEVDGKQSEENENVSEDGVQKDTESENSRREANSDDSYAADDDNTQKHGVVEETADFVGGFNAKNASSVGISDEETEVLVQETQDLGDEETTIVVEDTKVNFQSTQKLGDDEASNGCNNDISRTATADCVSSPITPRFNLFSQDSLQNSINNDNGGDNSRHRADDKDNEEGIEANVTNSRRGLSDLQSVTKIKKRAAEGYTEITTLQTAGNAFTKAVAKIAETGVFVLKLIECHSIRIKDLMKLSEENIGDIRLKLAADLFSELLAPDRRWSKDTQRSGKRDIPFL